MNSSVKDFDYDEMIEERTNNNFLNNPTFDNLMKF